VLSTEPGGCGEGDSLPSAFLADCCGRLLSLADLVCRHKALVIELGAGWCQECREQAPTQVAWHSRYAGKGLGVATVLKETDAAGAPANRDFCACWGEDYGVPYTLLIDPADELTTRCAPALPTTLVIDADGRIVSKVVGGDLDEIETSFLEALTALPR
jgi:Redoxin